MIKINKHRCIFLSVFIIVMNLLFAVFNPESNDKFVLHFAWVTFILGIIIDE